MNHPDCHGFQGRIFTPTGVKHESHLLHLAAVKIHDAFYKLFRAQGPLYSCKFKSGYGKAIGGPVYHIIIGVTLIIMALDGGGESVFLFCPSHKTAGNTVFGGDFIVCFGFCVGSITFRAVLQVLMLSYASDKLLSSSVLFMILPSIIFTWLSMLSK